MLLTEASGSFNLYVHSYSSHFYEPPGYFLFLYPTLIRLKTDSRSGSHSLKSVCTDSVFENINIIQDLTFLHIPKAVKPGLFSSIPELIFICDEYQFLSQNDISYRMPPSLTFLIGICHL